MTLDEVELIFCPECDSELGEPALWDAFDTGYCPDCGYDLEFELSDIDDGC